MIIHNKTVIVYDVEVFRNCFHAVCKNTETGKCYNFEISERYNHIEELTQFFLNKMYIFCGYNNKHFDDPIINYIIMYKDALLSKAYFVSCQSVYNLAQIIITSETTELWKTYKYAKLFESFDLLTMLYSSKLRVSLKEMQVTMHYKNVLEFKGNFDELLMRKDIPEMIEYNKNDVDSTCELLYLCKQDVELRIEIEREYGLPCLSLDGVNIGMKILAAKYAEQTGLRWEDFKDLRSPADVIALKDVILPFIKFKSPILSSVLSDMLRQVVSPGRKGYENSFVYKNCVYTVGVGGIHTKNKPEIVIPKEDETLVDIDVASLYPSMLLEYKFYPKHLGEAFLTTYRRIKEERIEAKHKGLKTKDTTLKLALNGLKM